MNTNLAVKETIGEAVERVLVGGDLGKLSADERMAYYKSVCQSVGLNPLTRPLEFITLNGKLTLYARKDATDQLRANNQVSISIVGREVVEGCYVVTAKATMPSGRCDESIGACPIENLKGEARSNTMMKTETKAKRRVTLSICGMGMLDESEIDSVPGARVDAQAQQSIAKRIADAEAEWQAEGKVVGKPIVDAHGNTGFGTQSKIIRVEKPLEFSSGDPSPEELSTKAQQDAFRIKFKEALPEKFRPHADQLRHAALAEEGYVDEKGVGTSKAVLRKDFPAVGKRLIAAAAKMTEPFIADSEDLPDNI